MFGVALGFGFAAFRFQRAVEIEKAAESMEGRGNRWRQIQRADMELALSGVSEVSA